VDRIPLAIGMKTIVTLNVVTDADLANGSRGEVVDIVLDHGEPEFTNCSTFPPMVTIPTHEREEQNGDKASASHNQRAYTINAIVYQCAA
jgi:hypothetical protein